MQSHQGMFINFTFKYPQNPPCKYCSHIPLKINHNQKIVNFIISNSCDINKQFRRSPADSGESAETAPIQDIIVSRDSDSLSSSNCIAQADSLKMTLDDRTDRDSMMSSVARLSGSEG